MLYGPYVVALILTAIAVIKLYKNDRMNYIIPYLIGLYLTSLVIDKIDSASSQGGGWLGDGMTYYFMILPGSYIFGSLLVIFYYSVIKDQNSPLD